MTHPHKEGEGQGVVVRRFACGHERRADNIKRVRNGAGQACLQCFRAHNREYCRNKRTIARAKGSDQ